MATHTLFKERRISFLRGLRKLSREHGIIISGCGCCDSPYLIDVHDPENGLEECDSFDELFHEDAGYATLSSYIVNRSCQFERPDKPEDELVGNLTWVSRVTDKCGYDEDVGKVVK